jgi:hypothetical protein
MPSLQIPQTVGTVTSNQPFSAAPAVAATAVQPAPLATGRLFLDILYSHICVH